MKRTITIIIALHFLIFFSCVKQKKAPEYNFVSLDLQCGSSDEKFPRENTSTSIDAGIFCLYSVINIEPEIVTEYGYDTRRPMTNKTHIDSVIITSDIDFNASVLAGDTLNDYFRIFNGNYFYLKKLTKFDQSDFTHECYYKNGPFSFKKFLLLSEKPTVLGNRKFYLTIKSGKKTFSDSIEINLF